MAGLIETTQAGGYLLKIFFRERIKLRTCIDPFYFILAFTIVTHNKVNRYRYYASGLF
jgi:hypothetical protein